MTSAAKTAAPPHAIRVWANGLTLFAEIPGDPPYVMRLSMTEGALGKVLNLLKDRDAAYGSTPVSDRMVVRKVGKAEVAVNSKQREAALEVLKKLGMVGR